MKNGIVEFEKKMGLFYKVDGRTLQEHRTCDDERLNRRYAAMKAYFLEATGEKSEVQVKAEMLLDRVNELLELLNAKKVEASS